MGNNVLFRYSGATSTHRNSCNYNCSSGRYKCPLQDPSQAAKEAAAAKAKEAAAAKALAARNAAAKATAPPCYCKYHGKSTYAFCGNNVLFRYSGATSTHRNSCNYNCSSGRYKCPLQDPSQAAKKAAAAKAKEAAAAKAKKAAAAKARNAMQAAAKAKKVADARARKAASDA